MRICQLIASRGDGGLEKHVRELSGQLRQDGHEVVVIGDRQFLASLPAAIERHPIPCQLSRHNPVLLWPLLKKLRNCRADIIHAQASKAASLISTLKPWLKTPAVATVHNIKRDLRPFQRLDHVITVSKQLAAPFAAGQASVVYNGIAHLDSGQLDLRQEFDLSEDRPVLCAVGRLVAAKGFDMLLEAINGLPVSLLIAGEGPEREGLQLKIDKLSPPAQCRLLGQRTDILKLIASSDAVVISSRREGFSYVFNEAVLAGSRILATDVPVANEVLPASLITAIADPQAFRTRLVSLLDNMDDWSDLMQQPRKIAAEMMTLTGMSKRTVTVYQHVLGW